MSTGSRREIDRRRFLATLGISVSAGLAGCLGRDSDNPQEPAGTFHSANPSQFETLNPLYNDEARTASAIERTLDPGYVFSPDGDVFPLLYDLWSDEGDVWVFEVRDGLSFSDPWGDVTAESFVYQIQELHQTTWGGTPSQVNWSGVDVERTGSLEFQSELSAPDPLWPGTFDPLIYPVPIDLIEPYIQQEDREGLQQDGDLLELQFTGNLGPYVLETWERGAGTTYTRNADYYLQSEEGFEDAPYFEEASIQIIPEEASRLGALETGELNQSEIPPARVQEFDANEEVDVYSVPQPYNRPIALNMRDNGWSAGPGNLFRYKEFRQAMACGIDKGALIEGIYRGHAEYHFTWQPEWSRWYPEIDEIPRFGVGELYGRGPARERVEAAIDRSGEDYGYDGDTLHTPSGEPVVLDLYYYDISPVNRLLAEFHAQELEINLGIEINVESIDGILYSTDYWQAEPAEPGISDEIQGEEVVWAAPSPVNPGPRRVTSENAWDMSVIFGLNTYPRHPGANEAFFDGATAPTNPVGWYPEFDAVGVWNDIRDAQTESEIGEAFAELFIELAYEQPYIMTTFDDDTLGYTAGLDGPIEDFANGWNYQSWHFPQ